MYGNLRNSQLLFNVIFSKSEDGSEGNRDIDLCVCVCVCIYMCDLNTEEIQ